MRLDKKGVVSVFVLIVLSALLTCFYLINLYLIDMKIDQMRYLHSHNAGTWLKNNYSTYLKDYFGLLAIPIDEDVLEELENHGRIETGTKPSVQIVKGMRLQKGVLLEQIRDVTLRYVPIATIRNNVDWSKIKSESQWVQNLMDRKNNLDVKLEQLKKNIKNSVADEKELEKLEMILKEYESLESEFRGSRLEVIDAESIFNQVKLSKKHVKGVMNGEKFKSKNVDSFKIPKADNVERQFSKSISSHPSEYRVEINPLDGLIVDTYILSVMKSPYPYYSIDTAFGNREERESVLDGEIEYILCGNLSDRMNILMLKVELIGIRTLLNLTSILSDAELMQYFNSLSATGPSGLVISYSLMAAYALYESNEDYKSLIEGETVPIFKLASDFHFRPTVRAGGTKSIGLYYGDYLRGLLLFRDSALKLCRVEHLIKLNYERQVEKKMSVYTIFEMVMDFEGDIRQVTVDVWE